MMSDKGLLLEQSGKHDVPRHDAEGRLEDDKWFRRHPERSFRLRPMREDDQGYDPGIIAGFARNRTLSGKGRTFPLKAPRAGPDTGGRKSDHKVSPAGPQS